MMYEYWNNWLNSQKMAQFVVVNLGSWSGFTVRRMAEEAGCIDFYNRVYQPFSAAVHSNWAHISDKNTVECQNPTHREHRIPTIIDIDPDPYWLWLRRQVSTQDIYARFDDFAGIFPNSPSAYDHLYSELYEEPKVE